MTGTLSNAAFLSKRPVFAPTSAKLAAEFAKPNCIADSMLPLFLMKSDKNPEANESPAPVVSTIFLFGFGLAEYKYFQSDATTPSPPFVITAIPWHISSIFLKIPGSSENGIFVKNDASS